MEDLEDRYLVEIGMSNIAAEFITAVEKLGKQIAAMNGLNGLVVLMKDK